MRQNVHIIGSKKEMAQLADDFSKNLSGGEVLLMTGVLGAGKTFFSNLIAKNLGVCEKVTSPTFSLCREYQYSEGKNILHFDLYRLSSYAQLQELSFEDALKNENNLIFIEWPECIRDLNLADKINELVPKKTIYWIRITFENNLKERRIVLEKHKA